MNLKKTNITTITLKNIFYIIFVEHNENKPNKNDELSLKYNNKEY